MVNDVLEKKYQDMIEVEVFDKLKEAHHAFIKLDVIHPNDITEWVSGIHRLQDLCFSRIYRRENSIGVIPERKNDAV